MKSKKLKKKKVLKRLKKPAKKKTTRKKIVKRKKEPKTAAPKVSAAALERLQQVGKIVHYFPQVKAGVIKITSERIAVGDMLYIKGHTTDFKQPVTSMQIEHVAVNEATRGQEIGLLVKARVRINDAVYKI